MTARVRVDGKQLAIGDRRFRWRGVTYGTFAPRADGARFPERTRVKLDFAAMRDAGLTVVRTYTPPTEDVVELAADWGLHLMAGVHWPDWRYLAGASRRQQARVAREARAAVRLAARRLAGCEQVAALCVGNEIPADVVRWVGTRRVADVVGSLADVARHEDPELLVTYATFPPTEFLPLDTVDFLTVNVFLDDSAALRRYLTRLHHLAGDRPVVLGELGVHAEAGAAGAVAQAARLREQLDVTIERGLAGACVFAWTDDWHVGDATVDGWSFGITDRDRRPRPALGEIRRWAARDVADLRPEWPGISVVVCAHDAAATIDGCLAGLDALDYPALDVVVVDDGSTDTTADIVDAHPRARRVSIGHAGLSVARDVGAAHARHDLVAYLDADAIPTPEWPYYLALGFEEPVVATGGPNLPLASDGPAAAAVALAPGGPVPVLLADDRAEHLPGCNLAVRRDALDGVDGFDPAFRAAGDDVDLCWRLLDRGEALGFHPAAVVWHHRRSSLRAYLRQQRGYGRAEAFVEARHPDRFTAIGTARWQGRIYEPLVPRLLRTRVYHGAFGAAPYQLGTGAPSATWTLAHQVGVPIAAALLATVPLAMVTPVLAAPALLGLLLLVVLAAHDVVRVPRGPRRASLGLRLRVATAQLLQPPVRAWARLRATRRARADLAAPAPLPPVHQRARRGVVAFRAETGREDIAARVVACLQRTGLRREPVTGFEPYDARLDASVLVRVELVSRVRPPGIVLVRLHRSLRPRAAVAAAALLVTLAVLAPPTAAVLVVAVGADVARGWWRTGAALDAALAEVGA